MQEDYPGEKRQQRRIAMTPEEEKKILEEINERLRINGERHRREFQKIREEYETQRQKTMEEMKRNPKGKTKKANWPEIIRGIHGGITVGMLGIMAITGLCVGAMKATKGKDR